jgi:hypothetical protein
VLSLIGSPKPPSAARKSFTEASPEDPTL